MVFSMKNIKVQIFPLSLELLNLSTTKKELLYSPFGEKLSHSNSTKRQEEKFILEIQKVHMIYLIFAHCDFDKGQNMGLIFVTLYYF